MSKLSRLYIYTDISGKLRTEVVTRIPNASFLANPEQGFQGKVIVEKWNGKFDRGFLFDGDSVSSLSSPQIGNKIECITISYYTCVETPYSTTCNFSYSETACGSPEVIAPSDPFAPGGGGGNDDGNGGDDDGNGLEDPVDGIEDLDFANRLCGEYAFKRVGNGMTVNITGLGGTFLNHTTGEFFFVNYAINCVTVANVSRVSSASYSFNLAWNGATAAIQNKLNSGDLLPNPAIVYSALVVEVNSRINDIHLGSTFINGICQGTNINATAAQYCDQ